MSDTALRLANLGNAPHLAEPNPKHQPGDLSNDVLSQPAVERAQGIQWEKPETARAELGDWPEWRRIAESIRQHTLANLPHLLTEFSNNVAARGGHVFFAQTAEEAREYIRSIIDAAPARDPELKHVVKSKSMVSSEIDLNPMILQMTCSDGSKVDVQETDLAEFILQANDWDEPSHIVVPDLHLGRDQIRDIFAKKLGYTGDNNPKDLAKFARDKMRARFLESDIGITGCNFAIANTGDINLVTNEGNADLTVSIPRTQIVVMGMERIVPTIKEAEILDNILARSAVGQKVTTYLDFLGRACDDESDGPQDFHVVILDNGRSNALGTAFEPVLQCIRCGACLNVCPIYRHIGGHAYGSIYPGPIGAVLAPVLGGYDKYGELPFWSSLCGACTETCPVKIPLHKLLVEHRRVMVDELGKKPSGVAVDAEMRTIGVGLAHRHLFDLAVLGAHAALGTLPKAPEVTVSGTLFDQGAIRHAPLLAKGWTDVRDLPIPPFPSENFMRWHRNHQREITEGGPAR